MFVVLIPSDVERHRFELLPLQRVHVAQAPHGLFAAEMLLELRCRVEKKYFVLCASWSIHSSVVLVSLLRLNVTSSRAESNTA